MQPHHPERLTLADEAAGEITPPDTQPLMPEPPPVTLVSIEDVTLLAPAGIEPDLDRFYVNWLHFRRDPRQLGIVYQADNFNLRFTLVPQMQRTDLRSLQILIPSLATVEQLLLEAEIEHRRDKALLPGQQMLILQDPAGNWIQLSEKTFV